MYAQVLISLGFYGLEVIFRKQDSEEEVLFTVLPKHYKLWYFFSHFFNHRGFIGTREEI